MSFLGIFGRRRQPSPVPAYAGTLPGKSEFYVLARADDRVIEGPFRDVARAGEVADAVSSGSPWRYEPRD